MDDASTNLAQRQFGAVAARYTSSAVHADGPDLDALVAAAAPRGDERVLDLGCGTGHTALALSSHVASVVGVDVTEAMLEQARLLATARGLANATFIQADAAALPFPSQSFDLVASRYSAHHYPRPARALSEVVRVLAPGGTFLLVDTVAPDDPAHDTLLNAVEVLRDPSHVRDYAVAQWTEMLREAGFRPAMLGSWPLRLAFDAWLERMATPPVASEAIVWLLDGASSAARAALAVEPDHSFSIDVALLRGRLPASKDG